MYKTIFDIKNANRAWAHEHKREYWFNQEAMSFFGSHIYDKVYGGHFFITSEQYLATDYAKSLGDQDGLRQFSIRICKDSGKIDTLGKHMGFDSLKKTKKAMEEVLAMYEKYIHVFPDTIKIMTCSSDAVQQALNLLSKEKSPADFEALPVSGAEVGVWKFTEQKLGPAQFYLVTQGFSKLE